VKAGFFSNFSLQIRPGRFSRVPWQAERFSDFEISSRDPGDCRVTWCAMLKWHGDAWKSRRAEGFSSGAFRVVKNAVWKTNRLRSMPTEPVPVQSEIVYHSHSGRYINIHRKKNLVL
jgi:hypothetical protein